jgi:uncharacterized protein YegJ (DUF2314 family)
MNRGALLAQICVTLCCEGALSVAEDHVHGVASDDAEMLAAINKARGSIKEFFDAFTHPKPEQSSFLLKVAFTEDELVEHIWLADLDFSAAQPKGVVANETRLKKVRFKQSVEFDPAYISDWMYIDHGKLVGGYTTRLLRQRMTSEERKTFDSSVPYTF